MKHAILKAVLLIPCLVLALGVLPLAVKADTTILVTSFDQTTPANTRAVLRADGSAIQGEVGDPFEGIVSIGYFPNFGDAAIAALQNNLTPAAVLALATDWAQFGTSSRIGPNFDIDSTYDFSTTDNLMAGSPFINQEVHTFIGNGSTYASSTELLVFDHNVLFTQEAPLGGPATVSLTDSIPFGTLLLGHFGASPHSLQPGGILINPSPPFPATLDAFGLEPLVPEPSRALLALVGFGACFLRRRR